MYDENIGVLHVFAGRVRLEPSKCQTSNVAHGKVTHWYRWGERNEEKRKERKREGRSCLHA